jgi:predicted kinase
LRWVIVTGLPASGKSMLAAALAARLELPLIAKDTIKEALFDFLGAPPGSGDAAAWSRRLSDMSYAVLFRLAAQQAGVRHAVLVEGNFRVGEHEAALQGRGSFAQVICRVGERERAARLRRRARSGDRHAGHLDASVAGAEAAIAVARIEPEASGFLDLPGPRFEYDSTAGEAAARFDLLLDALRAWLGPTASRPEAAR